MARMVMCVKYKKEMEGLPAPPLPGKLGQRIFENVSRQAWKDWLRRQIMIINEKRLDLADPDAHKILDEAMEKYFFADEEVLPPGYVPPNAD